MTRIQILELPTQANPDGTYTTPFALVIDQCTEEFMDRNRKAFRVFRKRCGAVAGLSTTETVDLPTV